MSEIKPKPLHTVPCTLTDAEWVSLINKEREGLSACCGNISALRDEIVMILREGAVLPTWNAMNFLRSYRVARDGHEFTEQSTPALLKLAREVAESLGYTIEEVHAFSHMGNRE